MKNIFEIVLKCIIVPSVNKKYGGAARFYTHRAHLADMFKLQHRDKNLNLLPAYGGLVGMRLTMITEKDYDNPLKALGDALQEAGVITDDENIRKAEIIILGRETPKGKDSLKIEIWKLSKLNMIALIKKYGGWIYG
jgi:Holliday junction resolvase RusA-like endonuclease